VLTILLSACCNIKLISPLQISDISWLQNTGGYEQGVSASGDPSKIHQAVRQSLAQKYLHEAGNLRL